MDQLLANQIAGKPVVSAAIWVTQFIPKKTNDDLVVRLELARDMHKIESFVFPRMD